MGARRETEFRLPRAPAHAEAHPCVEGLSQKKGGSDMPRGASGVDVVGIGGENS